jgi:hypothetical protein
MLKTAFTLEFVTGFKIFSKLTSFYCISRVFTDPLAVGQNKNSGHSDTVYVGSHSKLTRMDGNGIYADT